MLYGITYGIVRPPELDGRCVEAVIGAYSLR